MNAPLPMASLATTHPPSPGLVVADPGTAATNRGMRLAAGALARDARLSVPAGDRIRLGFAVSSDLIPDDVDLIGPAEAQADAGGLSVVRGSVHVRSARAIVLRTPHAEVHAEGATFQLEVRKERTRVEVVSGAVDVTSFDVSETRRLAAEERGVFGETVRRGPASSSTPAASVEATPTSDERTLADRLAHARRLARSGDVAGADAEARPLLSSSDATIAGRAAFLVAELELGRGQTAPALARLDDVVTTADSATAFDAATLLATRVAEPRQRVSLWERLLARGPGSPLRERAQVARAEALADAGERAEALAIARGLRAAGKLPDDVGARLARLEGRQP